MATFTSILLTLTVQLLLVQCDDVVLKPSNTNGKPVALILVQGAALSAESYVPLAQHLQNSAASASISLYVGIPEFPLDTPEPLVMSSTIERIATALGTAGIDVNQNPLFFAGHSLGGIMAQNWLPSNLFTYPKTTGLLLYGSFLTRSVRGSFNIPTLTVGGELDGLCRVTRIAEAFYMANNRSDNSNFPVVVIPGLTHMQFSSGTPPLFVYENDLQPEISGEDAYSAVASVSIDFITTQLGGQSTSILQKMQASTKDFVAPIIAALQSESFYHFNPPCFEDPSVPNCGIHNYWTEHVTAPAFYNLSSYEVGISNSDEIRAVWMLPAHLPHINNTCAPHSGCSLVLNSITENVYDTLDGEDTGFTFTAAFSMKTKLKSKQAILKAIGIDADWNQTDNILTPCGDVNKLSWDYALNNAAPVNRQRFDKWGVPMVMGPDNIVSDIGPVWIWTNMGYEQKEVDGIMSMVVTSVVMTTDLTIWPEAAQGMHYCKILSPARALEWLYIDSLRYRRGLNVQ